jgi:hypothetical protein
MEPNASTNQPSGGQPNLFVLDPEPPDPNATQEQITSYKAAVNEYIQEYAEGCDSRTSLGRFC